MNTPPEKVWLQLYGDWEPEDCSDIEPHWEEVTWSQDKINPHDVLYVKSGNHERLIEVIEKGVRINRNGAYQDELEAWRSEAEATLAAIKEVSDD